MVILMLKASLRFGSVKVGLEADSVKIRSNKKTRIVFFPTRLSASLSMHLSKYQARMGIGDGVSTVVVVCRTAERVCHR